MYIGNIHTGYTHGKCTKNIICGLTFLCVCVCVPPGEYLLFCKGADSSIFPRVVSGKVEQVKARVEQNAVVSPKGLSHQPLVLQSIRLIHTK